MIKTVGYTIVLGHHVLGDPGDGVLKPVQQATLYLDSFAMSGL